jgi:hypothetical protein
VLTQAVGVALDGDDHGVMQQPVEQGGATLRCAADRAARQGRSGGGIKTLKRFAPATCQPGLGVEPHTAEISVGCPGYHPASCLMRSTRRPKASFTYSRTMDSAPCVRSESLNASKSDSHADAGAGGPVRRAGAETLADHRSHETPGSRAQAWLP